MNARYPGKHQATRRALLADAYGRPCVLCGRPMLPGQDLDLDHAPDGSGYRGMAHATCNRADGGRRGQRDRRQRRRLAMDRIGPVEGAQCGGRPDGRGDEPAPATA